jgi:hypothetical protein
MMPMFGTAVVMVGLVPTIQPSASSGACRTLDPRDEPEDNNKHHPSRAER